MDDDLPLLGLSLSCLSIRSGFVSSLLLYVVVGKRVKARKERIAVGSRMIASFDDCRLRRVVPFVRDGMIKLERGLSKDRVCLTSVLSGRDFLWSGNICRLLLTSTDEYVKLFGDVVRD